MTELNCLACIDTDELAESRRLELDIAPQRASAMGWNAVEAAKQGFYETAAGERVDWSGMVAHAKAAAISIPPDQRLPATNHKGVSTTVQVANETTLQAGRRLVVSGERPLALNFANGVSPGGGFLWGALAQEETLCRSSALFATLEGDPMYAFHVEAATEESSAWSILSPDVPVFRDDDGTPLKQPWLLSFLTCAAPYAPGVGQPRSQELLADRILRVLEIASVYDYTTLVLGAWGCGAFQNDVRKTALAFREALAGPHKDQFRHVIFAVTDWSPERRYLKPFRETFSDLSSSTSPPTT